MSSDQTIRVPNPVNDLDLIYMRDDENNVFNDCTETRLDLVNSLLELCDGATTSPRLPEGAMKKIVTFNQYFKNYRSLSSNMALLHYFCGWNLFADAKMLIESGDVDVNIRAGDKDTPLIIVARRTCIKDEFYKYLVAKGAKEDDIDATGKSPEDYVALVNRKRKQDTITEEGPQITNARNGIGDTPLIVAVREDKHDVIAELLESGVNTLLINNNGETALQVSRWRSSWPAVSARGYEKLKAAMELSDEQQIRQLVRRGVDLNFPNRDGHLALPWAVRHSTHTIALLLNSLGAHGEFVDVNRVSAARLAPSVVFEAGSVHPHVGLLFRSAQNNMSSAVVFYLLQPKILETINQLVRPPPKSATIVIDPSTALLAAVAGGFVSIVRVLLEHQANPNVICDGYTCLQIASREGFEEIVDLLLSYRADVNQADTARGTRPTALFHAARNGHDSIVRRLLDSQAQVNVSDGHGRTPLHWAALHGHVEVVRLLLAAGAESTPDSEQMLPWEAAASGHHARVVELLVQASPHYCHTCSKPIVAVLLPCRHMTCHECNVERMVNRCCRMCSRNITDFLDVIR